MISLVANIINIFATTLRNILLLASFTGKLIVSLVTWIISVAVSAVQTIVLFFRIVYEDNIATFTDEIPACVNGFLDEVNGQLYYLQNGVWNICRDMNFKLSVTFTTAAWFVQKIIAVCSEVLCLIKNTVIFVGDTAWLIITFIPVHLPHLLRGILKYMGNVILNSIIDSYMTLLKFTNYLTEVPFQSFMGITSAIVIVRLCVHFRETILTQVTFMYWSLIRNILFLYHGILNYFINSEAAVIPRIVSGEDVGTREADLSSSEEYDSANAADALCVICQERRKCVLTLPCRHVCLCADCCRRLYGYQRTCPICRTFIYHSVTVYL